VDGFNIRQKAKGAQPFEKRSMNPILKPSASWRHLLIILTAVILVYGQTLKFDFVNYDDDELIYNNTEFLSQWKNIITSFSSHAFVGAGGESVYYRPLLIATLITDYHLWQINPLGYHLTNIILHIIATILVFLFMQVLVENKLTALFTALMFALHPIQTESVGWIAGRNDVLLGIFIVAMILFYAQSEEKISKSKYYFTFSIISFVLALFTKESAVFYILLLPLYDLYSGKKTFKQIFSFIYYKRFRFQITVLLIYFLIRWNIFGALIGAERLYGSDKPIIDRLFIMPAIVMQYLGLLIVPVNLSVAHPITNIFWLNQPFYTVAIIILFPIVLLIWQSLKKNLLIFFGLIWLIIGLAPAMNIVPMARPILEHRMYVPLIGLLIIFIATLNQVFARKHQSHYFNLIFGIIVGILLITSYVRLPVWQNGITLFKDAVQKAPNDLHANYSLARAYYNAGLDDETIVMLEKYINIAPIDIRGYRFLREVYHVTNKPREVARMCTLMIRLQPRNSERYLEAGVSYEMLNRMDTASYYYHQGLLIDSTNNEILYRLGIVEEHIGQTELAEEHYKLAVKSANPNVDAYTRLAKLYIKRNDYRLAVNLLESGLKIIKQPKDYLNNLSDLYKKIGEQVKATDLHKRFQF